MDLSGVARRLAEIFDFGQWVAWFSGLERGFVFLLLLPLVIAVIGLWGAYLQDDEDRK